MFARHGTWPQPPEIPLSAAFVTGGESSPFMLGPVVGGRQGLRMHGTSLDWQYPAVAARAIASGRVWAWAGRLPGASRRQPADQRHPGTDPQPEPNRTRLATGWRRVTATADADATAAGFQFATEAVAGTMYYVGHNRNFGNYRADEGIGSTSTRRKRGPVDYDLQSPVRHPWHGWCLNTESGDRDGMETVLADSEHCAHSGQLCPAAVSPVMGPGLVHSSF